MRVRHNIRIIAFLMLVSLPVRAQEFAREVSQFVGDNARPFLQPVVDALQSSIHAGLFHPAPAQDGIHVGVQLVAMTVVIPDERKTFTPKPFSRTVEFTYNGVQFLGDLEIAPASFPTAAGLSRTATFTGRLKRVRPKGLPYKPGVYDFIQQDATVTVGGYQDLSTIIVGMPQLTVGSLFGTDVMIRYIPPVTVPDIGEVKAFGFGARHKISRYFELPVDVNAQFMAQTLSMKAEDKEYKIDSDLSSLTLQIFVSRTFTAGIAGISPYIAFGYESGNLDVNYVFADPYIGNQNLRFESGGRGRILGGVSVSLWKLALHVDYNAALLNGLSFGVGFAF